MEPNPERKPRENHAVKSQESHLKKYSGRLRQRIIKGASIRACIEDQNMDNYRGTRTTDYYNLRVEDQSQCPQRAASFEKILPSPSWCPSQKSEQTGSAVRATCVLVLRIAEQNGRGGKGTTPKPNTCIREVPCRGHLKCLTRNEQNPKAICCSLSEPTYLLLQTINAWCPNPRKHSHFHRSIHHSQDGGS